MNNENPNVPNLGPVPETSAPQTAPTSEPIPVLETTQELVVPKAVDAGGLTPTTSAPETTAPVTEPQVRYNPVTGEEVNLREARGEKVETLEEGAVNNEEKLKTVDVEYKPTSTGNTVMLVIFFIALISFVLFLPDIQTLIATYKAGPVQVEEITTGRLVCTLDSSTVNLDRNITRVFEYENNQLKSAKFTTIVRGDATLDEETLNELNAQCEQVKANVAGLAGISVSCVYEEGKLTEKENFDYASYNPESVSAAYTEAGGSILEFKENEEIDFVMTNMRQGGFICNKEK